MSESGPHRMSPMLAQYTKVTGQKDPAGDYLCGSCMMFIPGKNAQGNCTAVTGAISATKGGCNLYMHGPVATAAQTNPNRLAPAEAGYVEDGPFSCKRCGNYLGRNQPGCLRVMTKGNVRVIEANECCNGWQPMSEVSVAQRQKGLEMNKEADHGRSERGKGAGASSSGVGVRPASGRQAGNATTSGHRLRNEAAGGLASKPGGQSGGAAETPSNANRQRLQQTPIKEAVERAN